MDRARDSLQGCGLPAAWAGARQWRILETGFGSGLSFLATWQGWREDPQRPGLLHFVAIATQPCDGPQIVLDAAAFPALAPLAHVLAAQWHGLLPGTHRLSFEDGRVLLTLHVGQARDLLRDERFTADSIYLSDAPALDADPRSLSGAVRALARHARRGTGLAIAPQAQGLRPWLAECGFIDLGPPNEPERAEAASRWAYQPHWAVAEPQALTQPTEAIVIGAGLAGAAVAQSLARRGWSVRVLDAAAAPATGASSLPVGLLAPHQSPDDTALSRLTRSGLRLTWQALHALVQGRDWMPTGVVEAGGRLPRGPAHPAWEAWTRPASDEERRSAGLPAHTAATWHATGGWARPGALVSHWLSQAGIRFQGNRAVHRLAIETDGCWVARDRDGGELGRAPLIVVAGALGSGGLVAGLPLQPVRGQVSWGPVPQAAFAGGQWPTKPANGNGHLVPIVPGADGPAWYCGATFGRDDTGIELRTQDHAANLQRLRELLPGPAAALAPQFEDGTVQGWSGTRCASADRRPLVGQHAPGLWVSCAMGSRGLSFALLCAEVLASRLHDEPLPLPARLAAGLDLARLKPGRAGT